MRPAAILGALCLVTTLTTHGLAFATEAEATNPPGAAPELTFSEQVDHSFATVVNAMASVLFLPVFQVEKLVPGKDPEMVGFPLVVVVLLFGGIFFTLYHRFLNFRGFKHAIDVVRGKYDNPDDPGEVSHFQALTAALSATVGLGNIAGVAVAVGLGGPGAVIWMIIIGLVGMSAKFHECTLAQVYRHIEPDGTVHGGPMYYLHAGLKEMGMGGFGKVLAVLFAILCVGGSFGGGNMFQANQSFQAIAGVFPPLQGHGLFFGIALAAMVGLVIIGGIKRIGEVTEKLIPGMCGLYVIAGLIVLVMHAPRVPEAFGIILSEAFSMKAGLRRGARGDGDRLPARCLQQRGRRGLGRHRPLRREDRSAHPRGHGRAPRALHRHRGDLHHDRPRRRGDRRLQQPRRRRGRRDDPLGLRRLPLVVPHRPRGLRVRLRVLDPDLVVLLR
ncbi:MAG: sodium:alanine symporter family protein [Myxococcales bacterium]|nr:sodium:alanine symporter family protein [Myxococcales bacterium]